MNTGLFKTAPELGEGTPFDLNDAGTRNPHNFGNGVVAQTTRRPRRHTVIAQLRFSKSRPERPSFVPVGVLGHVKMEPPQGLH